MLDRHFRLLGLWAALTCGGCASTLTVNAIQPFGMEPDQVSSVTAAFQDAAGNVRVCVIGKPATAQFLPGEHAGFNQVYSLVYPAARPPELTVGGHEPIPQYRITASDVDDPCPPGAPHLTPLPVVHAQIRDFGKESYSGISGAALVEFFDSAAEVPAIYVFRPDHPGSGPDTELAIVYVHEAPGQGTAGAVEIATVPRKMEGQPGFIVLLPIAAAIDIATSPLQLLLYLGFDHG